MYVLPRLNERSMNMSHVTFQATDLIMILQSRKPSVEIYANVTVNFDLLTIVRSADASFARRGPGWVCPIPWHVFLPCPAVYVASSHAD